MIFLMNERLCITGLIEKMKIEFILYCNNIKYKIKYFCI